jgi:hypothetical protein
LFRRKVDAGVAGYNLRGRKVLATFFSISKQLNYMEKAENNMENARLPGIQLSSPSSKAISTCEDCVQLTREDLVQFYLHMLLYHSARSTDLRLRSHPGDIIFMLCV